MTQPIPYLTPGVRGFRDRSTMLQVVGIFCLLAGLLCGCLAASLPATMYLPRPPGTPQQKPSDVVVALVLYALLAGGLIWLGIGLLRKRRWARPVVLTLAWVGLVGGTLMTVMWTAMLPDFVSSIQSTMPAGAGPKPPPMFFTLIAAGTTVFYAVLGIVVPALLIWLFKKQDVQATLEFHDPTPRWTDGVPLPVLGLSLLLVMGGLWAAAPVAQGFFPAYGAILTGWPARALGAALVAVSFYGAWRAFRRDVLGWRIALLLFTLVPLGWIITVVLMDLETLYRAMGRSQEEIDIARRMTFLSPKTMALGMGVMMIAALAFTLRTRRHFATTSPAPPADGGNAPPASA